jgi:hypothetical protein
MYCRYKKVVSKLTALKALKCTVRLGAIHSPYQKMSQKVSDHVGPQTYFLKFDLSPTSRYQI